MFLGFQFISKNGWFKFNIITWKQWTTKIKILFKRDKT